MASPYETVERWVSYFKLGSWGYCIIRGMDIILQREVDPRRARKARKGCTSGANWAACATGTPAYGTLFRPKPPTSGSACPILCALRGLRGSHVRLRVVIIIVEAYVFVPRNRHAPAWRFFFAPAAQRSMDAVLLRRLRRLFALHPFVNLA